MIPRVLLVAGARPNYMKIAPIWWAIRERAAGRLEPVLVHTGQHYDDSMTRDPQRVFDLVLSTAALPLALPVLAVAALLVRLSMGAPVLFRHTRTGRSGRPFTLYKLRTMRPGGDSDATRLTAVGRLLRTLSLDELPQLWNVLRGDMSLVGPRPTLRYQVDRYDERQLHRLDVLPGITGWAQIHGRTKLPWSERIELDLWYVEHRSPRIDLRILLRTPLALFGGTYKGSTGGWSARE